MANPSERIPPIPVASLTWRILQTVIPCLSPRQVDTDHYAPTAPTQAAQPVQPLALPAPPTPGAFDAVAPQSAPLPWFNRLMAVAREIDLVDRSGNLCLDVSRHYEGEHSTSIGVPDIAVSSFLTALHKARNVFIPDTLDDVMELMGSDTACIDLCMEAPLVSGVYSSETGRTYWIHQCMDGKNKTKICPFGRTTLRDLMPNQEFDFLFKAVFPKAYHTACQVKRNSLKEYGLRMNGERQAIAEQARLNALPINPRAEAQQWAAIRHAYIRGMSLAEITRRTQLDPGLVRAMLNIPEPDQDYLAAIAASLEEPDWGAIHYLPNSVGGEA